MIKSIKKRTKNAVLIIIITGFIVFIIFARPVLQTIIFIRKKLKAVGLISKVYTSFDRKIDSFREAISI